MRNALFCFVLLAMSGCLTIAETENPTYICHGEVCTPVAGNAGATGSSWPQFCEEGLGDCDGIASNGCETDLTSDASNCGQCGAGCDNQCFGGVCAEASSCQDLAGTGVESGVYPLSPTGSSPFDAWCDMDDDGGGWTLLVKIDGGKGTFDYGSSHWSSADTLNPDSPAPADDSSEFVEAKLAGYTTMPIQEVRLVMWDPRDKQSRSLLFPRTAPSLRDAMTSQSGTNESSSHWRGLMGSPAYVQNDCQKQGFDITVGKNDFTRRARLGIVFNDYPNSFDTSGNCHSPDSGIGVGFSQSSDGVSCGNFAHGSPNLVEPHAPNMPQKLKTYCYLYVR